MGIPLDQGCRLGWRFPDRTVLEYSLSADNLLIQDWREVSVVEVVPEEDAERGYYEVAEGAALDVPARFHGTIRWRDPATGYTAYDTIDLRASGPTGAGGGPGGTGLRIVGSLMARILDTPEVIDLLPGGFWYGPPDDEADENPPYAVLTWISEQDEGYVTALKDPDSYLPIGGPIKAGLRNLFQISVVGPDSDILDDVHEAWEANFNPRMLPLDIRNRLFRMLFNRNKTVDIGDAPMSPDARNTVVCRWDVEVISNINL